MQEILERTYDACFSGDVLKNCKLIMIQCSDPFLCISFISTGLNYIKFAWHNLRVSYFCHDCNI